MHILDQIKSIEGQLSYVNSVLNAGGLEPWQSREYLNLHADYCNKLIELRQHVYFMNSEYGAKNW